MKLSLILRNSHSGQFSIEAVFGSLLPYLAKFLHTSTFILPYPSRGLWPRLKNALAARKHQGNVNHITGDVNYLALFLSPHKTIITIHDCEFINRNKGIKRWVLFYVWLKWPVERARKVTAISNATKNDLIKLTRINQEKINVIYNPLTIPIANERTPSSNNIPRVLHIGTKSNKNLERTINALSGLVFHLDVVGRLNVTQLNLLKSADLSYTNHVEVPNCKLIRLYQLVDVLCFASLSEGFGLPILEAQANGCPVLTSNCSSMPEVGSDSVHYVDPLNEVEIKEGVIKILSDKSYRDDLIKKGYENVKRFEPSVIANQYLEVYQSMMS